jgi:redox-sensitive bicupin YhaK (pirin superfamily)
MLVFRRGTAPVLTATEPTRLVTLGGAPIGPRYIFWNFVSSRQERIVEAARAWKAEQFPLVPGDEHERIPLTEEPRFPAA